MLLANVGQQLVLAVEARVVEPILDGDGLVTIDGERLASIVAQGRFLPRSDLEKDPSHKQLIPYVVLKHGNDVFSYTRGRLSSETRLVAKVSIGLGGHIEWSDDSLFDDAMAGYRRATKREVAEEVTVATTYSERIAGLIYDGSTDVGRVHLGVLHIWELSSPSAVPRERKVTDARFRPIEALSRRGSTLESWSRIALAALAGAQ
jgi:predicted NUDIX family phosphoesterase